MYITENVIPLGFAMGDLGYSKYNHMPSYWDLWKGNCIFSQGRAGPTDVGFVCERKSSATTTQGVASTG